MKQIKQQPTSAADVTSFHDAVVLSGSFLTITKQLI
jgi:hypothetical protein